MEHIVYLVAVDNITDLGYIAKHSKKIEQQLKNKRGLVYDFGAIVVADWKKDYGEEICIGNNREDTLVYYNNREFIKMLDVFSYLIINGSYQNSLYNAYMRFFDHEQKTASATDSYHIILCDFRDESNVFVGNEADELIDSFMTSFSQLSQIRIVRKDSNSEAYERLIQLSPDLRKRIFSFDAHGKLSPTSSESISIMLSSLK